MRDMRKIFVLLSIIFLSFMVGFYGTRLVYFYNLEHKKSKNTNTIVNHIIENSNLLKNDLLKDKNTYYFKSSTEKNYLYYSGLMYRILYVNGNSITVISDNDVTNLKYGLNKSYDKSNIKVWLEDVYLKNLNSIYLSNKNVRLLDKNTFTKIGGKDSYVIGNDFWADNGLVITEDGISKTDNYSDFLAVRPVIDLKSDISYIFGDGTKENPYIVENKIATKLNDTYVGEYIKYNNMTFRIIEKNKDGVKVLSNVINNKHVFSYHDNSYSSNYSSDLGYYLNNIYIKNLDIKDLVKTKWYTGLYDTDYKTTYSDSTTEYIGLLKIGDYFLTSATNSFLLTKSEDSIYSISYKKSLFNENITTSLNMYPVFTLKGDLVIKDGNGYKNNPYIVGD